MLLELLDLLLVLINQVKCIKVLLSKVLLLKSFSIELLVALVHEGSHLGELALVEGLSSY